MNIQLIFSKTSFLLVVLLSLASCKKADVSPSDAKSQLIGRWQLQQTSGGLGGGTQPADPNKKRELVFTADGQARFLVNGTAEITTDYTVELIPSSTGQEQTIIHFGSMLSSYKMDMTIRELTTTKLAMEEAYADGQRYDYSRL